VSASYDSQHVA